MMIIDKKIAKNVDYKNKYKSSLFQNRRALWITLKLLYARLVITLLL